MSLPAKNSAWPPPELAKVTDRCAEAQVWWEGDTPKLNDFYGAHGATSPSGVRQRAKQAYQAFWGNLPQQQAQPIKRLHAPVAGEIVNLSARSLFSEPWTVVAPADAILRAKSVEKAAAAKSPLQKRIDVIFNSPGSGFKSDLYSGAESCSALGGNYQRVVWDPETADHAWIDFVDHDHGIPEFRWGRLNAVTFWSELDVDDDRIVLRHFQRYEKGRIIHALYEGTASNVGKPTDLDAHEVTRSIQLDGADDSGTWAETGVDELAARYVPNVAPNPEWRKDPRLKNMGRSDIASDVIPMLHEIDRIYSSLMRDFRIAAAKVYASSDLLTNRGPGAGVLLPEEQELFTRIGTGMDSEGNAKSTFESFQPEIRVVAHDAGGEMLLRRVLNKVGYSPISFGLSDEVAQTATEAAGKKERTVETTQGKARHWLASLVPLTTTCLRIDAAKFGGPSPSEDLEIETPPFARESALSKSQVVMNWETAGAASTRTKVAYLHDDWDEGKIDDEVDAIDSAATNTPDPFSGLPDDVNPNPNPPVPPVDDPAPFPPKPDEGE
ncbi:hypothetical protein CH267_02090 [Rhodococcus sp. 06-621-2]|nr:hypothetical protein [Rhodococcus sp. 06-621-2]OZC62349.1 hypothetical protein CH267_02090 [Rhodococcus sp. 06-621-2]